MATFDDRDLWLLAADPEAGSIVAEALAHCRADLAEAMPDLDLDTATHGTMLRVAIVSAVKSTVNTLAANDALRQRLFGGST